MTLDINSSTIKNGEKLNKKYVYYDKSHLKMFEVCIKWVFNFDLKVLRVEEC